MLLTSRWRGALAAAVMTMSLAACADEAPIVHESSGELPTTTTTTTAFELVEPDPTYPPYVPSPTTTTTAVPRTTVAPATSAPKVARAPRHTPTTSPPPPPTAPRPPRSTAAPRAARTQVPTLKIAGDVAIGGTWTGPVGARCDVSASTHPELNGTTISLLDGAGVALASVTLGRGHLAQGTGGSGWVCVITTASVRVPVGPSYSFQVTGQPLLTLTSEQLAAGGRLHVVLP